MRLFFSIHHFTKSRTNYLHMIIVFSVSRMSLKKSLKISYMTQLTFDIKLDSKFDLAHGFE